MGSRPHLIGLTLAELEQDARASGEPAFRGRQLYHALYRERQMDIARMTALPAELRERLAGQYELGLPGIEREFHSADHTTRFLLRLEDGRQVETVVMPKMVREMLGERLQRTTFCVSTQAGCAMACGFCATGQAGFTRQLTVGEIVEQVVRAARRGREANRRVGNIVFMGMGEPLANEPAVHAAVQRLHDDVEIGRAHV